MSIENKKEKIKVLYIDDEENNLLSFKATFRRKYKITLAGSPFEAKEILKEEEFPIIISDQRMPEQTGVEFFEEIRSIYPDSIRILLTGYSDLEAVVAAINKGEVYRYLTKPWTEEDLGNNINQAYEVYDLRASNKQLTKDLLDANQKLEYMLIQKTVS